jgi:hypothetical protein
MPGTTSVAARSICHVIGVTTLAGHSLGANNFLL